MKHALNDSQFPIISVHILKMRSGPKWPLFLNSLTYEAKAHSNRTNDIAQIGPSLFCESLSI